jgi:hypothetical protein
MLNCRQSNFALAYLRYIRDDTASAAFVIGDTNVKVLLLAAQPALACAIPTTQQVIVWQRRVTEQQLRGSRNGLHVRDRNPALEHSTGSLDLVRQITAGGKAADIVAPADFLDVGLFLKPAGYADYDIKFAAIKNGFGIFAE